MCHQLILVVCLLTESESIVKGKDETVVARMTSHNVTTKACIPSAGGNKSDSYFSGMYLYAYLFAAYVQHVLFMNVVTHLFVLTFSVKLLAKCCAPVSSLQI